MTSWLKRNCWRMALALAIGVVAFLVAHPSFAALQPFAQPTPAIETKPCDQRIDQLDPANLVTAIKVERHLAFDLILVFLLEVAPGDWRYVTVTGKNNCVVSVGF